LLLNLIALTQLSKDNKTICKLISTLTPEEIKCLFSNDSFDIQFRHNIITDNLFSVMTDRNGVETALEESRKILDNSKANGVKVVSVLDSEYPSSLKSLPSPPPVLYMKGNYDFKNEKVIACVGTRKPSKDGIRAVKGLIPELVLEDFTIVSGLAEGIDCEAHKNCLDNNGKTIAVLAHGLDYVYPKNHYDLAKKILNSGGVLLSEYPVGFRPKKSTFVARNRIISGLSKAVIVFESGIKSGTMHTVSFAQEQGKIIFYPVPVDSSLEQSQGLISLINSNIGVPLKSSNDYVSIVQKLGFELLHKKSIHNVPPKTSRIYKLLHDSIRSFKLEILESLKERIILKDYSIKLNEEVFSKFKIIAKDRNLSVEELFHSFLLSVVSAEEVKGEDERDEQGTDSIH
jgi:DNA processing protein